MSASDKGADLVHDFADGDGAVEYGGNRGKRQPFGAGNDQYCGDALDEILDCGISCEVGRGFQNDGRGSLIIGERAAGVVGGVHAERIDAEFAEFGANGGAQGPVGGHHENGRHGL